MKNQGHYIWNRAERVAKELMPDVVVDSFISWKDELQRDWKHLTIERRKVLLRRIQTEQTKMNESLYKLGYPEYNG
tara:strand:- start:146 stop:373 length:228 start_codon:yes stop_codon:yes gene_type:complete